MTTPLKYSLGLRGKLLIATLSVFLLPIASYFYLIELEDFLKSNQIKAQLESSRLMASYFDQNHSISQSNKIHNGQKPVYVYALNNTPVIDAYDDDWQQLELKKQTFNDPSGNKKISLYTGFKANKLFVFLSVIDNSISYKLPQYHNQHDRVILTLSAADSANKRIYHLETESPGWFIARQENHNFSPESSLIRGEWQENKTGYQLEFVIPKADLTDMMTIEVYDNEHSFSTLELKKHPKASPFILNPLVKESVLLSRQLQKLQGKLASANTRLYIINHHHEILARADQFTADQLSYRKPNTLITHLTNIYRAIISLDIKNQRYFEPLIHLYGKEIDGALDGSSKPSSVWLAGNNSEILVLSTASAIKDNAGNIIGALVMEKTNAAILALQDQTLENLLLISMILFLATGILLLIYSGRLVHRVLHLKKSIEKVMSHEGKLKQEFDYVHSHDEMGQLSRSFATLFQQLNRYTGYLETMVSKLSHELGTPLSIIKSSLENMQLQGVSDKNTIFLNRALAGSQRLTHMLTRMGEASRLEQALQSSDKEAIEINQFLSHYIEAIQLANSNIDFSLKLALNPIFSMICPELIAQLLDKLINNAISFHTPQSTIRLTIAENLEKSTYTIDIFNEGELIPDKIKNSLFDSMLSFRDNFSNGQRSAADKKEVNLGLGLHIAKLITTYHHGNIFYINRKKDNDWQEDGVSFIVELSSLDSKVLEENHSGQ